MAAKKFLRNVAGRIKEIAGVVTSAGAANDGDIPALDATGRLDASMMPVGIAPEVTTAPASENLASGDLVNLWNDTGTLKVRKADATAEGKEAHGFVLAAVTAPASATVYHEGENNAKSGLTIGSRYYLATTPGGVATTAPSGSGNVVQEIGVAVSATVLMFEPKQTITVA